MTIAQRSQRRCVEMSSQINGTGIGETDSQAVLDSQQLFLTVNNILVNDFG